MDKDEKIAELEKKVKWFEGRYGPYIEKRGIHNLKNLFRKPTLLEWTILFMIIITMFMGWAYQQDIKQCREVLENIDDICVNYKTIYVQQNYSIEYQRLNDSIFKEHIIGPSE